MKDLKRPELGTELGRLSAVTPCDGAEQLLSIRPLTEEGLAIKPNFTEPNPAAQGLGFRKDLREIPIRPAQVHTNYSLANYHTASVTIASGKIRRRQRGRE